MISVIIPLYNKECSIERTLESVAAQTYTDYEIVVVDDGSTDKSAERVISFKNEHPGIQLVFLEKPNGGVSSARNVGIEKASGEYVAFLDADDYWCPDFLREMACLIEEYPGKSIYGLGCAQIQKGEEEKQGDPSSYYRGVAAWDWKKMAFTGSSSCVKREDVIEVGLFDTRITHGEDLDMWWRLMLLHGGACDTRIHAFYYQDAENRAMRRPAPLETQLPYYTEKYEEARRSDIHFRRFFDREMIYRLYPYRLNSNSRSESKRIARMFDYSLQKKSMKMRMKFPYIYRFYLKIKRV